MPLYYVTWLFQERHQRASDPSDDAAAPSSRVVDLPVNTLKLHEDPNYGNLTYYPRIAIHDLVLCSSPDEDEARIKGPEKMMCLTQGDNSCWFDAIVTAMRMHGVGRLAYDASDDPEIPTATSLLLRLLRARWPALKTRTNVDQYRQPLLDHLISAGLVQAGGMANPGDLWDHAALGIPSISFNTTKKKTCTKCHTQNYRQTPQDQNINCIHLVDKNKHKRKLADLLNSHFASGPITQAKSSFAECKECGAALPLTQKTVMVDRMPYILCVSLPSGEQDLMPDMSNAQDVLHGVSLKVENVLGEEQEIFYKTVSIVYLKSPEHWVVANFLESKARSTSTSTTTGWFALDGLGSNVRAVDGRHLNSKVTGGAVARILYKRVYKECGEGSKLR